MELILEIILELFIEGTVAVAEGKFPLWARITAIVILSVLFIAVIILVGFVGISTISDGNFIGGAVFLVIDMILIVFASKKLIQILHK